MKKIQIIFIAIFFTLLLLPVIFFNTKQEVASIEKRPLAPRPSVSVNGKINDAYFEQMSSYVKDHFGLRENLISLSSYIEHNIFHKARIMEMAFEGKDGWLYFTAPDRSNMKDFMKQNLFTENELEQFNNNILETYSWCKENDIKCLFIIGPNKHSVYPEHYAFERPDGITRADQMSKVFVENNIPYVFSRDTLIEKKSAENVPLYYETDTHWNSLGAWYSFEEIRAEIEKLLPETEFPHIEYERTVSIEEHYGDLLAMLEYKSLPSTQIKLAPKEDNPEYSFNYIKNADRGGVITEGNKKLPKVILYRDSFFRALIPYFSPMFSNADYIWKQFGDEDKEYVLKNKPDLLIFESVERDSATLINK